MRIKSINIRNYRQYKDLSINFDKREDIKNDLQIIVASNGIGKSNLLNAITWCLYEDESHLQDKYKALPIVNTQLLSTLKDKDKVDVEVGITLSVDNSNVYIRRLAKYVKANGFGNGVKKIESKIYITQPTFDPSFEFTKDYTWEGQNAIRRIESIFPKQINEFFFFDNEQMEKYFSINVAGTIKKAINQITKVEKLDESIIRLKSFEDKYRRQLGKKNNNIEDLRVNLENIQKYKNDTINDLDEIKKEITKTEFELNDISEKIRGAENLRELQKDLDRCERDKVDFENKIKAKKIEIEEFICRYTILINMYPAFQKTLEVIKQKDQKRQLPPAMSYEVLLKTIENHKCELCGGIIDDLKELLIKEKLDLFKLSSPAVELLVSIKDKVNSLVNETKRYHQLKEKHLKDLCQLETKLEEVINQIIQLKNKQNSIANKEQVELYLDKKDILNIKLRNLYTNAGRRESDLNNLKREEQNAEFNLKNAISEEAQNNEIFKKYNVVIKLKEKMEEAATQIKEEIRANIQFQTFENFKSLVWKKNTYKEIKIDEEYNVELIHKNGYNAIGSCSAAERALLALSFTNAIHFVSGFETSLVIDSPVGRVSDENRRNFAKTISKISEDKQIIIFFTPDEYSESISIVLDDIACKYIASMEESEDVTKIERC